MRGLAAGRWAPSGARRRRHEPGSIARDAAHIAVLICAGFAAIVAGVAVLVLDVAPFVGPDLWTRLLVAWFVATVGVGLASLGLLFGVTELPRDERPTTLHLALLLGVALVTLSIAATEPFSWIGRYLPSRPALAAEPRAGRSPPVRVDRHCRPRDVGRPRCSSA
jgi:hypothetical protein